MRSIALKEVDAVVGNPPYIRQESIGSVDKSSYAELFRTEWPGQTMLSKRSDIYAYFFAHAARLLKPGGYLGFVTSVGWLDTEYGFRLQELFLRNFRIVAVIESQVEKWFEDARVTTAVTILQREPDPAKRVRNLVRFVQLRKPLAEIYTQALDRPLSVEGEATRQADMDAIRDLIEGDRWTPGHGLLARACPKPARAVERFHRALRPRWGRLAPVQRRQVGPVRARPRLVVRACGARPRRMTPLQELAEISRGFTSGADRFYCVRDVTQQHLDNIPDPQQFLDRWGISRTDTRRIRIVRDGMNVEHLVEMRFLEPELHSLMEVKRAVVRRGDVGRLVINAPVPRARLRGTHLAAYVAYAEGQGWHTGSTIASRARARPWYDLGLRPKSERADMFWSKGQQYRHVVPLNRDNLPANCALYDIWARNNSSVESLWAILNSTFVALSKHQFARSAGVEGNVQTDVISVNMMLVPDVRKASPEAAARAVAACQRMPRRDARRYLYEEFALDDRRELDDATLEMLGVEDPDERAELRDRLYRDVTDLQQAIREREIIAQRDRRRSSQRAASRPQDVADELWVEHESALDLLQFPVEFVTAPTKGSSSICRQGRWRWAPRSSTSGVC